MSYKDDQEMTRMKMKPRRVPEEEYDDHDRLFMSKSTAYNRKQQRRKFRDSKYTKKGFKGHAKNKHQTPDFVAGTNHERHVARREQRQQR